MKLPMFVENTVHKGPDRRVALALLLVVVAIVALAVVPRLRSLERSGLIELMELGDAAPLLLIALYVVASALLIPVFPFGFLNYFYGVSRVSLRDYLGASFAGMLPGTVMFVYAGEVAGDLSGAPGHGPKSPLQWAVEVSGFVATVIVVVYVTAEWCSSRSGGSSRVTTCAGERILPAERSPLPTARQLLGADGRSTRLRRGCVPEHCGEERSSTFLDPLRSRTIHRFPTLV